jgi:hypothetical protein
MSAEAFVKDVKLFCESAESSPNLPFKPVLLELYGRFFERKYDIYQEEKFQVPVNSAFAIDQSICVIRQMRQDYQLLALKVLFTEDQVTLSEHLETFFFNRRTNTNWDSAGTS